MEKTVFDKTRRFAVGDTGLTWIDEVEKDLCAMCCEPPFTVVDTTITGRIQLVELKDGNGNNVVPKEKGRFINAGWLVKKPTLTITILSANFDRDK